jgi:hypothetical protein
LPASSKGWQASWLEKVCQKYKKKEERAMEE